MAQLIVRRLDDKVKQKLKARASRKGRSLEAEARAILEHAVEAEATKPSKKPSGFGARAAELFKGVGFTEAERRRFDRSVSDKRRRHRLRFAKFDQ